MRDIDRINLIAMYERRWVDLGAVPQALGWTKGKQAVRFDVLLDGFEIDGATFLDVGCGFGDLNQTLRMHSRNYAYLGLDLLPPFISEARARYGDKTTEFRQAEFLDYELTTEFDYAVGCGIFAYQLTASDNYDHVARTLTKMFECTKSAVAVDFLSSHVNFRRPGTFYADPSRVLDIALSLSRNVLLKHNYMPFEFCVVIAKDDNFSEEDTIFNAYKRSRQGEYVDDHRRGASVGP